MRIYVWKDTSDTADVCTACTTVGDAAAAATYICTSASDSDVSACLDGYWEDTTGTASVCSACTSQDDCDADTALTCLTTPGDVSKLVCTTAPAGYYLDSGTSVQCATVSNAATGATYACTSADDSDVSACADGHWEDPPNGDLNIIEASYGSNCDGDTDVQGLAFVGNDDSTLQAACNGLASCSYTVAWLSNTDHPYDPDYLCPKDYDVKYDCGCGQQTAQVAGEADGGSLTLDCTGACPTSASACTACTTVDDAAAAATYTCTTAADSDVSAMSLVCCCYLVLVVWRRKEEPGILQVKLSPDVHIEPEDEAMNEGLRTALAAFGEIDTIELHRNKGEDIESSPKFHDNCWVPWRNATSTEQ